MHRDATGGTGAGTQRPATQRAWATGIGALLLLTACRPEEKLASCEGAAGVLVSETGNARGRLYGAEEPADLVDLTILAPKSCEEDCLLFEVEPMEFDDACGFLVSWSLNDGDRSGSPGRVTAQRGAEVAWELRVPDFSAADPALAAACEAAPDERCYLNMVHSAEILPDGRLAVADTLNSRVLILPPPHEGGSAVDAIIGAAHPDWGGWRYPNGVQVIEEDGRTLLLTTFKGSAENNRGRIVLWDITDDADIRRLWQYPEQGFLAAVHNAAVHDLPQGPRLLYAHSLGASGDENTGTEGSIGLAAWNGADAAPAYLADLLAPGLGFTREGDPDRDGATMLLTDSGCENQQADCTNPPRILTTDLPDPPAPGLGGGFSADHADQQFVDIGILAVEAEGDLKFPYGADRIE